jgi:hypothetical protein
MTIREAFNRIFDVFKFKNFKGGYDEPLDAQVFEIPNIPLYKWISKTTEYYRQNRMGFLLNLRGKNQLTVGKTVYHVEELTHLSFNTIKTLQQMDITEAMSVVLVVLRELTRRDDEFLIRQILKSRVIDFYYFYTFIRDGIKRITEVERKVLSYEPKPEEIQADVSEFDKFGLYNTIKALNDDIFQNDRVLELSYEKIFTELMYRKTQREYHEKYQRIIQQKNKLRHA